MPRGERRDWDSTSDVNLSFSKQRIAKLYANRKLSFVKPLVPKLGIFFGHYNGAVPSSESYRPARFSAPIFGTMKLHTTATG